MELSYRPGCISVENTYDNDTKTMVVSDYRDFEAVKAFQLQKIKERAGILILDAAPTYKQNNAALGLLSEEEAAAIKAAIQNIRTTSQAMESAIVAIEWDGAEETRGAACDAIQNIWWSS